MNLKKQKVVHDELKYEDYKCHNIGTYRINKISFLFDNDKNICN